MGVSPPCITFDSNAWEKVFDPDDRLYGTVRAALAEGRIEGRICESGFRIEAVMRLQRPSYFSQPYMGVSTEIKALGNGRFELMTSIGPDDSKHPGLSKIQATKLRNALDAGIKIMWGRLWLSLPRPPELCAPNIFVEENDTDARARVERQIDVGHQIDSRGIGKGAFDAANGWELRDRSPMEEKQLAKACAEWADGELVAAHIGYQNDILCTDDRAHGSKNSIFNKINREWLTSEFGVVFSSLNALTAQV